MLRILHTADVHLDSPFSSLDSRTAEIRRNELRQTFMSLMTTAKRISADLILIAGDLFDGDFVTRETVKMLAREFETYGKPVFIAPGNHDPASPGSIWTRASFPENVHVFTSTEPEGIDIADEDGADTGVTVYGFAFTDSRLETVPISGLTADDPERINLLVCHCDLTQAASKDCPVRAEDLAAFGADYAALGHIHNPTASGADNRWAYSGCPEPRGFDEPGPKGAVVCEIEKEGGVSRVNLHRIRTSRRRYESGTLDCTGCETRGEVAERIAALVHTEGWGEDVLCSLRLTGKVHPSLLIDTELLEADPFGMFLLRLTDETVPGPLSGSSADILLGEAGIRGEIRRRLEPALSGEDPRQREVALRALRYALSALTGDTV